MFRRDIEIKKIIAIRLNHTEIMTTWQKNQKLRVKKAGLISPNGSTVNLNAHKIKSVNDSCINCSYC